MKQLKLAANSVTYTAILEAAYFFTHNLEADSSKEVLLKFPKVIL
jgi:hypothetical protein